MKKIVCVTVCLLSGCATVFDEQSVKHMDDYTLCEQYGISKVYSLNSIIESVDSFRTMDNDEVLWREMVRRNIHDNFECRRVATSAKQYAASGY